MAYLCKESDFTNEEFEPDPVIEVLKMLGVSSLDRLKLPLVFFRISLSELQTRMVSFYERKHILLL